MRRWSEVAERVAATTRTSEKTALLADYLRSLSPEELPIAAVFFTGRPFAEADQRTMGLGWAAISAAVTKLADAPAGALGEAYDRHSDLGLAVEDVLEGGRPDRRPGARADADRGGRDVRGDHRRPGRGGEGRAVRRAARAVDRRSPPSTS